MSGMRRKDSESGFHHVMMRGVVQKNLFHKPTDYEYFMNLLFEYKKKFGTHIYHYCLMTNHIHLILRTDSLAELGLYAHFVQRRYAYQYRRVYDWKGQVFQHNFKNAPIETDAYMAECGRYIERNPVNGGIVNKPEDYAYSSYHYYAFGQSDLLVTESPVYAGLGRTPEERQLAYRIYATVARDYEIPDFIHEKLRKAKLKELSALMAN